MAYISRRQEAPPHMTPEYLAFNNKGEILSITGTFTGIALVAVLFRVYVRCVMLRVFGMDDYIIVLAMLLSIGVMICIHGETQAGLGRHLDTWTMADLTAFSKWMFAQSLLIVSAVSTVKISVGLSLARLWRKTKYVKFLWGVIIFTILFCLACLGTLIFQCLPVRAAWDFSLRPPPLGTGNANCYSISTFRNIGLFNSVVNILTDVLFATMPIPLVWQLQLNTRTKLSLITILSLGYFASAAAVIKTINQWNFFYEKDWSVHDTFNVWNVIELDVGIVAACLPSLKPLFNWALETARAITTGSGNRRTGNRYGYGYSSNKRSSIGYVKQADSSIMAMDDLGRSGKTEFTSHISSTNASGKSRDPHDPYNVRMSAGQHGAGDAEAWNWSEGNAKSGGSNSATTTVTRTGGSSPSSWDHEARKKSDDHILPLQNFPPRGGKGGIVRTTEVTVS